MKYLGGESERGRLNRFLGYSAKAQRTGRSAPSYLDANSQSMQKNYREEVAIGWKTSQKHVACFK
jgi:hypothetical protein